MKRHTLVVALAALAVIVSLPLAALAGTATTKSEHPANTAHKMKLDLNTAGRDELMKLPGITEATADKIMAARPFKSVGELESKKILSPSEYKSVQSHLMVKSAAQPQAKAEPSKEYHQAEAKPAAK
jgi:competence protein ComEA